MKRITIYALSMLALASLLFNSCKKDLIASQKVATVSTIATGYYTNITVDKSGNIYALQLRNPDTIYKITASGGRTAFYVPPTTMDHDTVMHHPMQCLTTDSAGNIYTVAFNGISNPDLIKITPAGTASVVYSNISMGFFQAGAKIAFDPQGNFYYSGAGKLYKVSAGGTTTIALTAGFVTFTPDVYGNIYYANAQSSVQKLSAAGLSSAVGTGKILGDVYDLGADVYGNVFVSTTSGNGMSAIQKLDKNDSVKTIISCNSGHVDGPLNKAQLSLPLSQVTDASGNLYFLETDGMPWYIRKITF